MTWRRITRLLLAALVLLVLATGCRVDREEATTTRKPTGKIVRDGDLVCYDGVLPQCYRIAPPELEI